MTEQMEVPDGIVCPVCHARPASWTFSVLVSRSMLYEVPTTSGIIGAGELGGGIESDDADDTRVTCGACDAQLFWGDDEGTDELIRAFSAAHALLEW